jgi:hypothetical protein
VFLKYSLLGSCDDERENYKAYCACCCPIITLQFVGLMARELKDSPDGIAYGAKGWIDFRQLFLSLLGLICTKFLPPPSTFLFFCLFLASDLFYLFMVLGIKPRASHLLGKCSITPSPTFLLSFSSQDDSSLGYCCPTFHLSCLDLIFNT